MKEFEALTGGRFTYADDIKNLQDLALSICNIFDGCGDFIVSGCTLSGNQLEAGYVYLSGKLRYFSGGSVSTVTPSYIIPQDTRENVSYKNGLSQLGRTVYGCTISGRLPVDVAYITINPTNMSANKTLENSFIGKYAVLKNLNVAQTINSELFFNKQVSFKERANFSTAYFRNGKSKIIDKNNALTIQTANSDGLTNNELQVSSEQISFIIQDIVISQIFSDKVVFKKNVEASQINIKNLTFTNSDFDKTEISFGQEGCYWLQEFGDNSNKIEMRQREIVLTSDDGRTSSFISISPSTISFTSNGVEVMYLTDEGLWLNGVQCDSGVFNVGGKIKENNVLLEKKYLQINDSYWKRWPAMHTPFAIKLGSFSAGLPMKVEESCYKNIVSQVTGGQNTSGGTKNDFTSIYLTLPVDKIIGLSVVVVGNWVSRPQQPEQPQLLVTLKSTGNVIDLTTLNNETYQDNSVVFITGYINEDV